MITRERVQAAVYAALFAALAGSAALFVSQFATSARFWRDFTLGYLILLLVYTWYLFVLLFLNDVRPHRHPRYEDEKIAVQRRHRRCGFRVGAREQFFQF